MKKNSINLFVGIIIGMIVGVFIGYLIFGINRFQNNDFKNNNFQINEETENEIISFFDSSPTDSEIENYCKENMMYCMHYCREINSAYEFCGEINFSPGEFPKK